MSTITDHMPLPPRCHHDEHVPNVFVDRPNWLCHVPAFF